MGSAEQINLGGGSELIKALVPEVFIQRESSLDQFPSSSKKKNSQGSIFGEEGRKFAQLHHRGPSTQCKLCDSNDIHKWDKMKFESH